MTCGRKSSILVGMSNESFLTLLEVQLLAGSFGVGDLIDAVFFMNHFRVDRQSQKIKKPMKLPEPPPKPVKQVPMEPPYAPPSTIVFQDSDIIQKPVESTIIFGPLLVVYSQDPNRFEEQMLLKLKPKLVFDEDAWEWKEKVKVGDIKVSLSEMTSLFFETCPKGTPADFSLFFALLVENGKVEYFDVHDETMSNEKLFPIDIIQRVLRGALIDKVAVEIKNSPEEVEKEERRQKKLAAFREQTELSPIHRAYQESPDLFIKCLNDQAKMHHEDEDALSLDLRGLSKALETAIPGILPSEVTFFEV